DATLLLGPCYSFLICNSSFCIATPWQPLEQFNCPVCLDLPSDPVTIPCGHSYCKACIADYWENEGRKNGTYSCPECRQTFNPRPTLCRNTMLAEAVEQLRRGALSSTGRESIKSARSAASSASERAHTRSKGCEKLTLRVFRPQSPESETSSCNVSSFLTHLVFSFCFLFSHLFVSLSLLDACDLTLDPNTAHRRLVLSDGDTVATLQQTSQPFPDLPQRFDGWTQVLCLQPLSSDRCYWEVEWRGCGSSLGVVSGSMSRKGADTGAGLGYNSQSWSLELSDMCCAAMHANKKVEIPVTYSPRVGVFLDRTAGTLTFYSVDDELVPLHAFQGSFPPPLYAAFGVGCGANYLYCHYNKPKMFVNVK
uniref:Tripartite motif containing 25, like n=1 Tax=Sinocyclocheilus anshuiensis TaxID=1608454 RepID=A0A671NDH9_9TELE